MTMNDGKSGGMSSEINVTPMIDVLLVLLIIFMVIVPSMPRGEAAQAPRPNRSDVQIADAVVLEVLKGSDGQAGFKINQQTVARQDLAARLSAIYANRAQRVLFVKGDDQVSFNQVAEAIDIGHAAGVDRVGLMTPRVLAGQ
ncbi:MAG: biopolymer transporter ExbD [Terracidiphilus sp.]